MLTVPVVFAVVYSMFYIILSKKGITYYNTKTHIGSFTLVLYPTHLLSLYIGQTLAQIHAVVQRLLRNREETVRHAVFKLNNNGKEKSLIAGLFERI